MWLKKWDKLPKEEIQKKVTVQFLQDKLIRLRETRKSTELQIEITKNEIREIEPDNVYLDHYQDREVRY
jgi:hypothetical protein